MLRDESVQAQVCPQQIVQVLTTALLPFICNPHPSLYKSVQNLQFRCQCNQTLGWHLIMEALDNDLNQ